MSGEPVLLTHTNTRLHLHARDNIRAVRIDRIIASHDRPVAAGLRFRLRVLDEAGLPLWHYDTFSYAQSDEPEERMIDRTFAVWDTLTIELTDADSQADLSQSGVQVHLFYTVNPD